MDEQFRVENYTIDLRVWPLHHKAEREIEVVHGARKRTVVTDNRAHLNRSVRFAKGAQPRKPYVLRYATRGEGYVYPPEASSFRGKRGKPAPVANLAGPEHRCRYDDFGKEVHLAFLPAGGRTYSMGFDVLRGFDAGARDAHFHLFRPATFEGISLGLDLSAYIGSGFTVSHEPGLYFHASDVGGHDSCPRRGFGDRVEPVSHDGGGIWRWELGRTAGGVLDVVWDVQPPDSWNPLPVASPGLEQMGPVPHLLTPELMVFHRIGQTAAEIAERGKPYSLAKLEEALAISRYEIENSLEEVHDLFGIYFGKFGHAPHRPEPFGLAEPSLDVPESQKLFHRCARKHEVGGNRRKGHAFQICSPHGWGAWKLTRQYLQAKEIIP